MTKAQKNAIKLIIKEFEDFIKDRGVCPEEMYTSPMTGERCRNGVTIDVRQLKILAGIEPNEIDA